MVTVAELAAKLNVKDGGSTKRLRAFGGSLTELKSGLELAAGVARVAANAIRSFTTDIAAEGDTLAKTAKNLGINVTALQEFEFAAKLSGVGLNDVRTAVQRMQKGLNDARQRGTGPFADALAQINLTVQEFDGLAPDELFTKLSGALSGVEDATTRAALAQDLFGRGGKTLLPLINEGADGINRMRKEFRELGGGFTEDGAVAAEEFVDEMLRVETVIDSVKIAVGTELLPIITEIAGEIKAWALENRALIRAKLIEFVQKAVKTVKEFLPTLQKMLSLFFEFIPVVLDVVKALAGFIESIGGLETALEIAAGAWVGFQLATTAALGPVGLIAGAFAVLLPLALELGDRLGDVALEIAGVTQEAQRLEAQAGGRTKLRGAAALLATQTGEAGAGVVRTQLTRASDAELDQLAADKNIPEFGKGLIKQEQKGRRRQKVIAASLQKSRAFEDNARQIRALREEIKGNKRLNKELDKLSQDVSLGKITASQARERIERSGTRRKGRKGKRPKKGAGDLAKKDREFEELLTADSLRKRVAEGQVTPTILVTVTNFNINQSIEAPINITGLSSSTAQEVLALVQREFDDMQETATRRAIQDTESRTAR